LSRILLRRTVLLPPLILTVVWVAVLWWPSRSTIDTEESRLTDLQTEQLALVTELNHLTAAEERVDEFERDLTRFAVAVPPTTELDDLLRSVDAEASTVGLQIELFAPTNVADSATAKTGEAVPPSMSSVSLALTGVGTFDASMAFVKRLESMDRLVVIDALSLSSADNDPNRIIVDLAFRVFTNAELVGSDAAPLFVEGDQS
jgi:Tfp pilus assembly protein PilO